MEKTEWMDCGGNLLVRQGPHGFWWELLETDAAGFERFSTESERAAFEAWLSANGTRTSLVEGVGHWVSPDDVREASARIFAKIRALGDFNQYDLAAVICHELDLKEDDDADQNET